MRDDLDVTEAILLDDTTALLYVGRRSAGEGLTEEEAQASIDHFGPYVEWRGMALEHDFQALTLVEGKDLMKAHEAQSQKSLRGWGRPKVSKLPAPLGNRLPMGVETSPYYIGKGVRSDKWADHRRSRQLDRNNCFWPAATTV